MDLTELPPALAAAGVPDDEYLLPGSPGGCREGGLFLAEDGGGWLIGSFDLGRHVVSSSWPDEDTACTELFGRLTLPLPAATDLGEQYAPAVARTQAFVADLALGGEPAEVVVPAGLLLDRFGSDHGRWLFAADTPFAQRSLPPDLLDPTRVGLGQRVFLVVRDLVVRAGVVAPWFGQPGGAARLDLVGSDDVWTLARAGVLQRVQPPA